VNKEPQEFSRFGYQLDPKLHIQSVHEVMYSDAITYDPQDVIGLTTQGMGLVTPFGTNQDGMMTS